MFIKQSDIFWGLDRSFTQAVMENARKESHLAGEFLFREGDPAESFFILLKGCVKLTIGNNGHTVYSVDHPGEAFGWSSLIGRSHYSASAECVAPTKLLNIEAAKLSEISMKNSSAGLVLYKRLSGLLGNRLIQTYKMISTTIRPEISYSFGTGQVTEWYGSVV